MSDAIRWVEIPTERIERAAELYSTVLDREPREAPGTDGPYLLFETADDRGDYAVVRDTEGNRVGLMSA
jgi:predicted enzyme related to lactoylglutathione lyase